MVGQGYRAAARDENLMFLKLLGITEMGLVHQTFDKVLFLFLFFLLFIFFPAVLGYGPTRGGPDYYLLSIYPKKKTVPNVF